MRHFNYSVLLVLLTLAVIAGTSCGGKWKKPARVTFEVRMKEAATGSNIHFTTACLYIRNLHFTGERKQGKKSIDLDHRFEPSMYISLTGTPAATITSFDIPQGTYSDINLQMVSASPSGVVMPSLQLEGFYDIDSKKYNFRFQFEPTEIFKLDGRTASGGKEIVLMEDKSTSATLTLNPGYWFETVPLEMITKAELTIIPGTGSIVMIDKENNTEIYQLIISRLTDGNETVFN